ncbi:MAG: GTP 3',8-cyclase MoaA [Deltaproteobacteria bacterium]|nr:GTP 3',8-cyclase MoaA [Deltaproteobacteria bacterium]MDL1960398.1 GTP 3',8-cyclase MoaA [Deltaproteobacteria bacterium]
MKREKNTLIDRYGRQLTYLRLSITDRCNLRCQYCMPQINFSWLPHDSILTYEEILKVCRTLATIGITKVRLTGGEPLVRRDLINLIERLTEIEEFEEICITTNGVLLEEYADSLYQAGIRHINISLDSLSPVRFAYITGFDLFEQVWRGIEKALEKGFSPIKINSVIMKGINDNEITALAGLSMKYPVQVRFIEFMPVGQDIFWNPDRFISCDEIKSQVEDTFGMLCPLPKSRCAGPASEYVLDKAPGSVGFIGALSHNFCESCNRLRITAEGRLRLCLFSDEEVDVKKALRQGLNIEELTLFFHRAVSKKPKGFRYLDREGLSCNRGMSSIGG